MSLSNRGLAIIPLVTRDDVVQESSVFTLKIWVTVFHTNECLGWVHSAFCKCVNKPCVDEAGSRGRVPLKLSLADVAQFRGKPHYDDQGVTFSPEYICLILYFRAGALCAFLLDVSK